MAYVSNFSTQSSTTSGTSFVLTLPAHVSDDILMIGVSCDNAGSISATWGGDSTGSGQVGSTLSSGTTLYAAVFYAKATGTAATCTLNLTNSDAIHVHMIVIKDCDTTTFYEGGASSVSSVTLRAADSLTTTTDDCLVVYYAALDGPGTIPGSAHSLPGPTATMQFVDSSDNGGTTATTIAIGAFGWYIQRSAGAVPTPDWEVGSSNTALATFTVAFRNKSGGIIPAYVDDYTDLGNRLVLGNWVASFTTTANNQNYPAGLSFSDIGPNGTGQPTAADSPVMATDLNLNISSSVVQSTPSVHATNATGFQVNFPTTSYDMTTGWIVGAYIASTARFALGDSALISNGGTYLVIGQGTSNYRSYQIMGRDNEDGNGVNFTVFSVQANQTTTQFGYSSTAPTITNIDRILLLHKGHSVTGLFNYCDIHLIKKLVVAGGINRPIDAAALTDVGKFCRIPLIKRQGASQLQAYTPIQIGGGDQVNFQIDAGALQFPQIYSVSDKLVNYHGSSGAIGISYAGKSGDTIKHTNSVISSKSAYYWEINSAATSSATWDFTGLVLVKANVTLRNVMTFTGMTFSDCGSIDASGCTVVGAVINKAPTGNNTLTTNGTTSITNSSIDVSLVSAGNYYCSVASPVIFQDCDFTGGGGHAIRITSAGTYTLTNLNFTGFGSTGTTGAAIFNDSGGAVTLNISGGSTPTYYNGSGASTTVVSGTVSVTVTAVESDGTPIQNARVLLRASNGTGDFPYQDSVTITRSGTTATVSHTAHGMATNDYIQILGADQPEYDGVKQITYIDANSYSYTVSGSPATPATGTITGTFVALYGLTDVNGEVTASRVYTNPQPVVGWCRKSSGSPYYQEGVLTGTISATTGFSATGVMVSDE